MSILRKNKNYRISWRTRNWKINYFKYIKNYFKEAYELDTVIFSIDDFYKTLNERKLMSKRLVPYFLQGVPVLMILKCYIIVLKI